MYSVDCCPKGLVIGKQGENEAEKIAIDFSPWASEFGAGTISARLRRPKDSAAYPVALITEGTTATWTISATDTQYAGAGSLQLVYIVGDVVAKSVIWPVRVLPSLEAGEAPEPYESWLDTLEGLAADTQGNARDAAASAADAAQSATSAAASAQDAAESAASITGLTAVAETLPEGSEASASFDGATDTLTLGIPKGDTGAAGPKGDTGSAGADGFSPSATVTKQDGNITITITDKDGTTSETLEVDDALDETSENPVQNQAIQNALWNMLPVDTANGAIASFSDGADDVPMLSLKAQIEPVQDLHGYDNPWLAGGGKQKISYPYGFVSQTSNGCTATVQNDGTVAFSGTPSVNTVFNIKVRTQTSGEGSLFLPEGDYILNGSPSGGSASTFQISVIDASGTTVAINRANEAPFTVPSGGGYYGVQLFVAGGYNANSLVLKPMIRLASVTDATFAPYSNICPISGHTGVNVQKTGVNVLNLSEWECESNSGITIGTDNISIFNKAYQETLNRYNVLNRLACVFSFHVKTVSLSDSRASFAVYADGTAKLPGSGTTNVGNITLDSVGTEKDISLTVPNGTEYISFGGWAWSGTVEITNIQLELGSTATDYEAYQSETIPVSWETEAGTVYGGTVDVVSGVLTVTHQMLTLNTADMNNDESYPGWRNSGVRALMGADINYTYTDQTLNVGTTFGINTESNRDILFLPKTGAQSYGKTQTEWIALAQDVQILVELATPLTVQLTAEEVATYLGQNNIWADTGDTEVTYRADIAKYIEKKVSA